MAPSSMDSSKLMQRSNVLLPEPDEPMNAITSLADTSRSMPFNTERSPKDFVTDCNEILGFT